MLTALIVILVAAVAIVLILAILKYNIDELQYNNKKLELEMSNQCKHKFSVYKEEDVMVKNKYEPYDSKRVAVVFINRCDTCGTLKELKVQTENLHSTNGGRG